MKKRFTDCDKWNDPWFMELSPDAKLAWTYICDRADNAGVWDANMRLANFSIKKEIDWDSVLVEFGNRVEVLPKKKWWITRFVFFQCGSLRVTENGADRDSPPHRQIVGLLRANGIRLDHPRIKGEPMEDDEEPDEAEEQQGLPGMKKEKPEPEKIEIPPALDVPEFADAWQSWTAYRRERHLSVLKPRSVKMQYKEIASWGLERAIAAINYSIRQNYQGIYEEKSNGTKANQPSSRGNFTHRGDYSSVKNK